MIVNDRTELRSSTSEVSLAREQRSLGDPSITYPLWPVLSEGCPRTSTERVQYPLEVSFELDRLDTSIFDRPPAPGLRRWAPLLPPLAAGLDLGEGGTPLIPMPRLAAFAEHDDIRVKDESRNPTWSHKDRLNLCTVSAAVRSGARGVVVASSGNHGASAAAFAAAAGLPCVIVASAGAPPAVQTFMSAFGAAVVAVPSQARWPVMREIVRRLGYHPVSNLTPCHTGHPFGPEGYKTIAYEIFLQLGRIVPAAVFVPTGYGELLYGVFKGFVELRDLGLATRVPRLIACEPAVRAPLAKALADGTDVAFVEQRPTQAYSVAVTVSGYRSLVAVRGSGGRAVPVSEEAIADAQRAQARAGLWHELSSVTALAALRQEVRRGERYDGTVVLISTSSGFKDKGVGATEIPATAPEWDSVAERLRELGIRE